MKQLVVDALEERVEATKRVIEEMSKRLTKMENLRLLRNMDHDA